MSHRRPVFALAAASCLLAGCAAEAPYALTDYRSHQRGLVQICYDDATATPRQVLEQANQICGQYQRQAVLQLQQKYQCTWTAPTLATFYCLARPGETPPPIILKNNPMRHESTAGF